jgi:rubrerythrin
MNHTFVVLCDLGCLILKCDDCGTIWIAKTSNDWQCPNCPPTEEELPY